MELLNNYNFCNNIICNINNENLIDYNKCDNNNCYYKLIKQSGGQKHIIDGKKVIKEKIRYIKILQNQLQILDSLLNDGSQKKYIDSQHKLRYSEHSGLFDFDKTKLDKIIISGKTNREDNDDTDILLPQNMEDAMDYELMFHTHPPTPYPGARAINGILYEFPSISDLYHYAYHFNEGNIQASMIVAPEGIYIIKINDHIKKIDYPSDKAFKKMEIINIKINELAIKEYGIDYSNHRQKIFYEKVAQNTKYIKMFNRMVKKYFHKHMSIQYKPREYDRNSGKWIIKNLYIKISPVLLKSEL
jgi:hypothetical protein